MSVSRDVTSHWRVMMCAITTRALLTDKGKSLVRANADTWDTQKVCSLLQMHASKSTMPSVDSSVLLGCTVNQTRLSDMTTATPDHTESTGILRAEFRI